MTSAPQLPQSKRRVLVVEDDAFIREAIQELLEFEGFAVTCAKNGQDGIDTLRDTPYLPDVILLDLMMPIRDGFSFRAEQMQDHRLNQVPVVIMSADGNIEEKSRRAQASAFLRKPVELSDVLSAIDAATRK